MIVSVETNCRQERSRHFNRTCVLGIQTRKQLFVITHLDQSLTQQSLNEYYSLLAALGSISNKTLCLLFIFIIIILFPAQINHVAMNR